MKKEFVIFHGTKGEYVDDIIKDGVEVDSWFGELYHALRVTTRKNRGNIAVLKFVVTEKDIDMFYGRKENVWRNKKRLYPVAKISIKEDKI